MKRYLTLLALLISFASFAKSVPAWDVPLIKSTTIKPAKPTTVYVNNYGAYVYGTRGTGYYGVQIQVSFNQSVPAPYYAVIEVNGKWGGANYGSYREFIIYFNQGQWSKNVDFPMAPNEEAYTSLTNLTDYGPQ